MCRRDTYTYTSVVRMRMSDVRPAPRVLPLRLRAPRAARLCVVFAESVFFWLSASEWLFERLAFVV